MRYHLAIPGEVADAGQRQAGDDGLLVARNAGLLQALIGGTQDLGKRRGKTEADIGGPRLTLPQHPAGAVGQARPAPGTAAIHSKKQDTRAHGVSLRLLVLGNASNPVYGPAFH